MLDNSFSCEDLVLNHAHCIEVEKILLVENPSSLSTNIVNSIKEKFDIVCDVAYTVEEANSLLLEKKYDLVLTDIFTTDILGCFIEDLVENEQKVIVLTESEDEAIRLKLSSLQIVDFILKFDDETIVKMLTESIERLKENQYTVVAVCDDLKTTRMIICEILKSQNFPFIEFSDGAQVYKCLLEMGFDIDILLTDIMMPGMNGLDLIRFIRKEYSSNELPIVAFSTTDKNSAVPQALKLGANDFVKKPFIREEFLTRLNRAVDQVRIFKENKSLIKELDRAATIDFLTGLYNRTYFHSYIKDMDEKCSGDLGVVLMDIDHFKNVNDTYGHDVGDITLKAVSATIKKYIKQDDIVCRWGGEEFLAIIPDTNMTEMKEIGERLRAVVEAYPIKIESLDMDLPVTISVGVALGDSSDVHKLIEKADEFLYKAKNSGRNRVCSK